jgi:restriction system protein
VLITTSRFSQDAVEYVEKIEKRIILVDGQQLAELMIAHEVGVSNVMSYIVKRVDQDYFEE